MDDVDIPPEPPAPRDKPFGGIYCTGCWHWSSEGCTCEHPPTFADELAALRAGVAELVILPKREITALLVRAVALLERL